MKTACIPLHSFKRFSKNRLFRLFIFAFTLFCPPMTAQAGKLSIHAKIALTMLYVMHVSQVDSSDTIRQSNGLNLYRNFNESERQIVTYKDNNDRLLHFIRCTDPFCSNGDVSNDSFSSEEKKDEPMSKSEGSHDDIQKE